MLSELECRSAYASIVSEKCRQEDMVKRACDLSNGGAVQVVEYALGEEVKI